MGLFEIPGVLFLVAMINIIFVEFGYGFPYNFTVSLDGTGNYGRINDAIAAVPNFGTTRFYIHVKPGTYHEYVVIPPEKTYIALIGDDPKITIIDGSRSNGAGFSTPDSATFTVKGNHFMAKYITFQNSAGPENHQAVALFDSANYTSYYNCIFKGYQDTLYSGGKPQFYKQCDIYGSVDFIFGHGLTLFQDCNIYARLPNTHVVVTAQSKNAPNIPSGFVFQTCTVTVSPEIISSKDKVSAFLGRPWRKYSTVVFMECFLDGVVHPEGWVQWPDAPFDSLFYAEYNNRGPGADTSRRVKWPSFHVLRTPAEASKFALENFIDGPAWLPETGIPFRTGL